MWLLRTIGLLEEATAERERPLLFDQGVVMSPVPLQTDEEADYTFLSQLWTYLQHNVYCTDDFFKNTTSLVECGMWLVPCDHPICVLLCNWAEQYPHEFGPPMGSVLEKRVFIFSLQSKEACREFIVSLMEDFKYEFKK